MYDIKETTEFKRVQLLAYLNEINRRRGELFWNAELLPKQKELYESKAKVTLYIGGNRSGKTFGGAFTFAQIMCREHTSWKPIHDKPLRGWVVGLDSTNMLKNILIPQMEETIPKRYIKNIEIASRIWTLKDGSRIQFKTSESTGGDKKFQSDNLDVIWIDEECPEDVFDEIKMRVIDRNGIIIMTMTPTQGMSWSYEKLYKPGLEGKKVDGLGAIKVIEANTEDNPYLPEEAMTTLLTMFDSEEERQMRLHGKYILVGGHKIFPFTILEHVRKTVSTTFKEGDLFVDEIGKVHFLEDCPNPGLKVYEGPLKGERYYVGVDSSEGINDPTCITVSRERGNRIVQVAEFDKIVPPEDLAKTVVAIGRWYNNAFINVERNSTGMVIVSEIYGNKLYPISALYLREKDDGDLTGAVATSQIGTHTDAYSKARMIRNLRGAIQEDRYIIVSEESFKEMDAYVEDKNGKIRASFGHDDRVCAHFLCQEGYESQQIRYIMPYEIQQKEFRYGQRGNPVDEWVRH